MKIVTVYNHIQCLFAPLTGNMAAKQATSTAHPQSYQVTKCLVSKATELSVDIALLIQRYRK